jgi:hypothetical protein
MFGVTDHKSTVASSLPSWLTGLTSQPTVTSRRPSNNVGGGDVFAMFASITQPKVVEVKVSLISDEALLGQTLTATIKERATTDTDQYIGVDEETGELPDRIFGTYTDDYNILQVHALIMARFSQRRKETIGNIERYIKELQGRLRVPHTLVERKAIQEEITRATFDLDRIVRDIDLQEYLQQSSELLDLYRTIGTKIHTVSFAGSSQPNVLTICLQMESEATVTEAVANAEANIGNANEATADKDNEAVANDIAGQPVIPTVPVVPTTDSEGHHIDTEDEIETLRHLVISSYLEIARQYIIVDVIREISTFSATKCIACQAELTDDDPSGIGSGMRHCYECGVERNTLHRAPFYRDVERVNTSDRNGYDNSENFEKALMRYQGKQPNRLPVHLFKDLDEYFLAYGLPLSEKIRELPLNAEGEKDSTSRETMLKALSDTGYPTYYEDINLVCHLYWGWLLPDVAHLEDQIMEDYRKTQQVYDQIPKDRKSCLNTQYRLFKHLEARGHKCKIDEFKVVKTRDILEYHDDTWRVLCEAVGLPFFETL